MSTIPQIREPNVEQLNRHDNSYAHLKTPRPTLGLLTASSKTSFTSSSLMTNVSRISAKLT
ncbi:hypothetical protein HDU76_011352, partial [Blyttiomyces sp. JEL0837]